MFKLGMVLRERKKKKKWTNKYIKIMMAHLQKKKEKQSEINYVIFDFRLSIKKEKSNLITFLYILSI